MCSLSRRGSTSLAGCQPLEGATDLPRQALTAGHDVTLIRLLKFGVGRVSKGQHVTASIRQRDGILRKKAFRKAAQCWNAHSRWHIIGTVDTFAIDRRIASFRRRQNKDWFKRMTSTATCFARTENAMLPQCS
eukprot:s2704_g14.t1